MANDEKRDFPTAFDQTVKGIDCGLHIGRGSRIGGPNLPPAGPSHQGLDEELYTELWRACAGQLAYLPRAGEKVFYFPQGHLEQVNKQHPLNDDDEVPLYNLPSWIFCKVVHVQLTAEAATDEVFAQVTLHPERKQDLLTMEDGNSGLSPFEPTLGFFAKTLTTSDTQTHGGFSIPRRKSCTCFPPLDMTMNPPVQDLATRDLNGRAWQFRHIFRGQPKRHLLTSGWSNFVSSKRLSAGDTCIFMRGRDGDIGVGVRRATKLPHRYASTTLMSPVSMQHGVLASAYHALTTETILIVYYYPWISASKFIVPFEDFMRASEIEYGLGSRFRMPIEGEGGIQKRITGTVIENSDIDPIRWPQSEWKCLKVQWDTMLDAVASRDRVCPWDIEPVELIKKKNLPFLRQPKLVRPGYAPAPGYLGKVQGVLLPSSTQQAPGGHPGFLLGQGSRDTGVNASDGLRPQDSHFVPWMSSGWVPIQQGFEQQAALQMHAPSCQQASRNLSVPNVTTYSTENKGKRPLEVNYYTEAPVSEPDRVAKYRLFGVDLVGGPPELPSNQVATSGELGCLSAVTPVSGVSVPGTISGFLPENNLNVSLPFTRSCTKVFSSLNTVKELQNQGLMKGSAGFELVRAVDVNSFSKYQELVTRVDNLFGFGGTLIDGSSSWDLAYLNGGGEITLIRDSPWQVFQLTVKRIFLCRKET